MNGVFSCMHGGIKLFTCVIISMYARALTNLRNHTGIQCATDSQNWGEITLKKKAYFHNKR